MAAEEDGVGIVEVVAHLPIVMPTVRHQGQIIVIDHVPADVCSVCGDVLLKPDTVRRIEGLLEEKHQPASTVPLYEFA